MAKPAPIVKQRVVALIGIRNEAMYLPRCLAHLEQQGLEVCIIDNESSDGSLEIARQSRAVFRIESQPYNGCFDLFEQLRIKEWLAEEIDASWFVHQDADEILEAAQPGITLREAFIDAGRLGYNVVNFDEFVFLPAHDDPSFEHTDYVRHMRNYYFFAPSEQRLQRSWRKTQQRVELAANAGHRVEFVNKNIHPQNFRLRHYIVLSRSHMLRKYGRDRVYSRQEVEERHWHGPRAHFDPIKATLPPRVQLRDLNAHGWDKSDPVLNHLFFGS